MMVHTKTLKLLSRIHKFDHKIYQIAAERWQINKGSLKSDEHLCC